MGGLRDVLRRAFDGRSPEEALADFKEKLHAQINEFRENPETHSRLQTILQSILRPLQQFNLFIVRPALNDKERLKAMASRYGVNKIELKRVLKTSLELEETLKSYFKDPSQMDQLVVTLRKVVNVIDEDVVTGFIDAIDYNIDYGKIEKAYLDYQSSMQKAYNVDGLNRDLKELLGNVSNNLKNAFGQGQKPAKGKASDRQLDAKMLEPELQNLYNRYREEGFTHEESMRVVQEKSDLDGLSAKLMDAYRAERREGRNHSEAFERVKALEEPAPQSQAREIPITDAAAEPGDQADTAENSAESSEQSQRPEA